MGRIKIKNIMQETVDTKTFFFDVTPYSWEYKAGQYITFTHIIDEQRIYRSYSLATNPYHDPYPAITVKRVAQGKFSNYLHDHAKIGDFFICSKPRGNFTIENIPATVEEFVFFAGGSGIVPILSMIKATLQQKPHMRITLVNINHNEASIIYHARLITLQKQHAQQLDIIDILTKPTQVVKGISKRPTAKDFQAIIQGKKNAFYWLCAPEGLMDLIYSTLFLAGVSTHHIRQELFSPLVETNETIGTSATARVHTRGETHTITIAKGEKLLDALLDAGLEVPFSCCGGICNTCRVKCIKGKVHMLVTEGLSKEEADQGYILSCVSYPTTEELIIDLDD